MQNGYRRTTIDGVAVLEHRLAWLYVHGRWPSQQIDHINGNRTDNRIANLREVSQSVNMRNLQGPKKNSQSGVLGVIRHSDTLWRVRVTINRKAKHIGYFQTREAAAEAYAMAALDAGR